MLLNKDQHAIEYNWSIWKPNWITTRMEEIGNWKIADLLQ